MNRHYSYMPYIFFISIAFLAIGIYLSINDNIISFGGDSFGVIANIKSLALGYNIHDIYSQPFSNINNKVPSIISDIYDIILYKISPNYIFCYNLHIFIGIIGVLLLTYFLSEKLLNECKYSRYFSFIFSLELSFSAFNTMHLFTGHMGFLLIFQISLFYYLYNFHQIPNIKNSVLLGLIFAINLLFNFYYGYFSILIGLYTLVYVFVYDNARFKYMFKYLLIGILFAIIVIILPLYQIIKVYFEGGAQFAGAAQNRPIESLGGVLPWMYLMPSPQHFLATNWYKDFFRDAMMIVNVPENSVYLGWVNIIFFVYGFTLFIRDKFTPVLKYWFGYILGGAIFCFLLSMPPYIPLGKFGKFFWLSTYLHKVFPMFRIYNRFGFYVLFFVSIGAMMAMYYLIDKYNYKKSTSYFKILPLLIFFEIFPKIPVIDLGNIPDIYSWLKIQNGNFIIYELPEERLGLREKDEFIFYKYLYFQTFHGKKLFNRTPIDNDFNNPKFRENLKSSKVKYIIQHIDYYDQGPIPIEYKNEIAKVVSFEKFSKNDINILKKYYQIVYKDNNVIAYKIF